VRDVFERIADLTTSEDLEPWERLRAIKSLAKSAISSIDHPPPVVTKPKPPPVVNTEGLGRAQRWMVRQLDNKGVLWCIDLKGVRWGTLQSTRTVLDRLIDRGLVWLDRGTSDDGYRLTAAGRVLADQMKGK
jgi:hypothetical protein